MTQSTEETKMKTRGTQNLKNYHEKINFPVEVSPKSLGKSLSLPYNSYNSHHFVSFYITFLTSDSSVFKNTDEIQKKWDQSLLISG